MKRKAKFYSLRNLNTGMHIRNSHGETNDIDVMLTYQNKEEAKRHLNTVGPKYTLCTWKMSWKDDM